MSRVEESGDMTKWEAFCRLFLCPLGVHWKGVKNLGMYGDASRCSLCGTDRYGLIVIREAKK